MKCKAVWFNYVGTCLDWHSGVVAALPLTLSQEKKSEFALQWKQQYVVENKKRVENNLPVEDVDIIYREEL